MQKEDSGLPEFGLQRLDEWSILGITTVISGKRPLLDVS